MKIRYVLLYLIFVLTGSSQKTICKGPLGDPSERRNILDEGSISGRFRNVTLAFFRNVKSEMSYVYFNNTGYLSLKPYPDTYFQREGPP